MADRLEFAVEAAGVADELAAVLAGEEDEVGESAVAGCVFGADGFALGCAGAGGVLGIAAVGCELGVRWHGDSSEVEYGMRVGGKRTLGGGCC